MNLAKIITGSVLALAGVATIVKTKKASDAETAKAVKAANEPEEIFIDVFGENLINDLSEELKECEACSCSKCENDK